MKIKAGSTSDSIVQPSKLNLLSAPPPTLNRYHIRSELRTSLVQTGLRGVDMGRRYPYRGSDLKEPGWKYSPPVILQCYWIELWRVTSCVTIIQEEGQPITSHRPETDSNAGHLLHYTSTRNAPRGSLLYVAMRTACKIYFFFKVNWTNVRCYDQTATWGETGKQQLSTKHVRANGVLKATLKVT